MCDADFAKWNLSNFKLCNKRGTKYLLTLEPSMKLGSLG